MTKNKNDLIFILGSPKSGTTLLQSLFNGHSQLFVMPLELCFFQHKGLPSIIYQHKRFQTIKDYSIIKDIENLKQKIITHKEFQNFFDDEKETPRGISSQGFNKDIFYSYINNKNFNSEAQLLYGIILGMAKACNFIHDDNLSQLKFIEKTPLQEEFASHLKNYFPNGKFIHILRNPYALFCSLRKRFENLTGRYPDLEQRVINIMKTSYYFMEKNRKLFDNYSIIKYEDILKILPKL